MDNALKQRALGIIVLFALIGICITVLLHNNKVAQEQGLEHARQIIAASQKTTTVIATTTPALMPKPQQEVAVISQPTTPTLTIPTTHKLTPLTPKTTRTQIKSTTNTPPLTTTTTATTTSSHTTATFSVQVGTFSDPKNAAALVKALHERGFSSATTQSAKTKHGEMTRVVIGGDGLTRKEAETIKLHLSKNLHLNGIISPLGKTKTTSHVASSTKPTTHNTHSNTKTTKVTKAASKKTTTPSTTTTTSTTDDTTSDDSGAVVIP